VHGFALSPMQARRAGGGLRTGQETAFVARVHADFEPRLSDEHCEWGWFSPREATDRLPWAGLRRAVRLAGQASKGRVELAPDLAS
jgi:hypothetical protein